MSGGLHGVGASVVNALSTWLEVKVYKNSHIYYQKYVNGGHPLEPLKLIGDCDEDRTGTTVTFYQMLPFFRKQLFLIMKY